MPDFIYNKKLYYNPVEFALDRIGGTWKMPILWRLDKQVMRFGELRTDIPHITDKMLATQLKALEADGFITRKVYAEVPPRVEYAITKRGKRAVKMIQQIRLYGIELMEEFGVSAKTVNKHKTSL